MTVIVWDGTTLAADRRRIGENSDVLCEPGVKITVTDQGAMATAGNAKSEAMKAKVIAAVSKGDRDGLPDVTGMVVLTDARAFLINDGDAVAVTGVHAIGSAHEVARGAMAAGADARRAAEIACELVVTCGDGVDVYRPGEGG